MTYDKLFNTRAGTPQNKPIPGREEDMSENYAGGYAFTIDKWDMLDRFLILGSDTPTYYAGARELTEKNAKNFLECIKEDGVRVVDRIVEISESGRAHKNDPALFALAACSSPKFADVGTRRAAASVRSRVARTGSHHLMLVKYEDAFRGWGRIRRRSTAKWFEDRDADELAYQMLKYQSRYGYSQADLLRLSHPVPDTPSKDILFNYVINGTDFEESVNLPERAFAFEEAKKASDEDLIVNLIEKYNLTREFIPGQWLSSKKVWEALVETMPLRALLWNLAKLTSLGIIAPMSEWEGRVVDKLINPEAISRSRIHPLNVLITARTYAQGHGERGSLTWDPSHNIVDALDEAFYLSFGNLPQIDKRVMICLDVSGSMGTTVGTPGLTARDACAAMALSLANSARQYHPVAFSHKMEPISLSTRSRLDDVIRQMKDIPYGYTDCALPMLYAMGKQPEVQNFSFKRQQSGYRDTHDPIPEVDAFVILTDNETWFGKVHPAEALFRYREKYNPSAKLVVCGVTATGFSIADPNDTGMLDVVGFDSALPNVIASFLQD